MGEAFPFRFIFLLAVFLKTLWGWNCIPIFKKKYHSVKRMRKPCTSPKRNESSTLYVLRFIWVSRSQIQSKWRTNLSDPTQIPAFETSLQSKKTHHLANRFSNLDDDVAKESSEMLWCQILKWPRKIFGRKWCQSVVARRGFAVANESKMAIAMATAKKGRKPKSASNNHCKIILNKIKVFFCPTQLQVF